jgi:hypothetical protein
VIPAKRLDALVYAFGVAAASGTLRRGEQNPERTSRDQRVAAGSA